MEIFLNVKVEEEGELKMCSKQRKMLNLLLKMKGVGEEERELTVCYVQQKIEMF